jgi:hypothetical protein
MGMFSQEKHEPFTSKFLNLWCLCPYNHLLSDRGITGTMESFPSLYLHHAELTPFVKEIRLLILYPLISAIDRLGWFQLIYWRKVRMRTEMRDVDSCLMGRIQNHHPLWSSDFYLINDKGNRRHEVILLLKYSEDDF